MNSYCYFLPDITDNKKLLEISIFILVVIN